MKKSWRMVALLSILFILLITNFGQAVPPERDLTLEEQLQACDVMMNPEANDQERIDAWFSIMNQHHSSADTAPVELKNKMSEVLHYLTTTEIAYSGRDPMHGFSRVEEAMYQSVLNFCDKDNEQTQLDLFTIIQNDRYSTFLRQQALLNSSQTLSELNQEHLAKFIANAESKIDFDQDIQNREAYFIYLNAVALFDQATALQLYRLSEEMIATDIGSYNSYLSMLLQNKSLNSDRTFTLIRVGLYRPDKSKSLLFQAFKAADADLVRSRPLLEKIVESRKHDSGDKNQARRMLERIESLQ